MVLNNSQKNSKFLSKQYRIAVVGAGYVGLSLSVLLAQHHRVIVVDIIPERVELINARRSPIRDPDIEAYFKTHHLNLTATLDACLAYQDAEFVIVATPTNYDAKKNSFDTSSVEAVIQDVQKINSKAIIVIKSTIPVGFVWKFRERSGIDNILFSPEFLREGKALYDNLYPSRIIVGTDKTSVELTKAAETFANLLVNEALGGSIPVFLMDYSEAEAVKLFANTYLAMRIGFFNELDGYAEMNGLNTRNIIDGIGADPRIGMQYNNPSFGYGGYCLPKDTKQLLANFSDIPQRIMTAIVETNDVRKDYITQRILAQLCDKNSVVGIYRLVMKSGSDNFRESAIVDIVRRLAQGGVELLVYEPTLGELDLFEGHRVVNDLRVFKRDSTIILANRYDAELIDVREKVYSRDLFSRD